MDWWILIGVIILSVIGVGGFVLLKPDNRKKAEWKGEVATGEPSPMRERILTELRERSPRQFRHLRVSSIVKFGGSEWDEFWETLKSLEAEGKVVRVANATETSDSLWALPTEESDES